MATTDPTQVAAAAAADVQAVKEPGTLASVVIAPEYAMTTKTKLTMQNPDELGAEAGHAQQEYHVTSTGGKTYFMLKPATASFTSGGGKKQLFDAQGKPLVDIEKKLISMHGTWLLTRTGGTRIAEVKPSKKVMNVYINDGDKEADYVIEGAGKAFTIKDCHRKNAVIATVKKATPMLPCMKPKTAAEAGKWNLLVFPGVDAAFVTALAMICENVHGKAT